jgi:hypothetical protein
MSLHDAPEKASPAASAKIIALIAVFMLDLQKIDARTAAPRAFLYRCAKRIYREKNTTDRAARQVVLKE